MKHRIHRRLSGLVLAAIVCCGAIASVRATPYVVNGDFETDTELWTLWPGYAGQNGVNPPEITGWIGMGGRGINPVVPGGPTDAPFRDNGANVSHVAFLQGVAYIEQQIAGFSVGSTYWLGIDFNARNCCTDFPVATLFLNGQPLASSADLFPAPGTIPPVGEANPWYHADIPFTALEEIITLRVSSQPAAGGDASLVVDNISVRLIPEPATALLGALGIAAIALLSRRCRS